MSNPFDIFGLGANPERPEESPARKAQIHSARPLTKRFYKTVDVVETEHGFQLELDGREVKTPARKPVQVPHSDLAQALAEEWRAQETVIDPKTMPLTRLINSAIDGVADQMAGVTDEIVRYAGSDLVCYRVEGPQRLVERQMAQWDPVLTHLANVHQCRFVLAGGILHVEQPAESLAILRALLEERAEPLWLAAFHSMTTLTGSCLLTVMVADKAISAEEAWNAAHVDEDWNIEQWGFDEEAHQRRLYRKRDMDAAALVLSAC